PDGRRWLIVRRELKSAARMPTVGILGHAIARLWCGCRGWGHGRFRRGYGRCRHASRCRADDFQRVTPVYGVRFLVFTAHVWLLVRFFVFTTHICLLVWLKNFLSLVTGSLGYFSSDSKRILHRHTRPIDSALHDSPPLGLIGLVTLPIRSLLVASF